MMRVFVSLQLEIRRDDIRSTGWRMTAGSPDVTTPARKIDNARCVALIEEIAVRRSRAAFAELFRIFAPRLKSYVMRAGVEATTAEEVAQEAMIAVWRKADSFDRGKASVSTWIFTIVRNKRIDMLRREARPDLREEDFLHLNLEPDKADDTVSVRQVGDVLEQRVGSLPPDQTRVIEMAYYEDKSHSAIAEELGVPLGTVKSRIRLALSRLKDGLGAELK